MTTTEKLVRIVPWSSRSAQEVGYIERATRTGRSVLVRFEDGHKDWFSVRAVRTLDSAVWGNTT